MNTVPRYGVGQLRFSTFFGLRRSPTPRAVGSKERADREQWPYGYLQFPFLARRRWPRFDITNDGVKQIAYGANETARDLSACPAELQFLGRVPAAQFSQTINNKTRSSATELNVDEHGPIQQSAAIRRVAEDDGHVFVGARSGQPQFSGCHPSSTAARF